MRVQLRGSKDEGVALVAVVVTMVVITLLLLTAMAYVLQNTLPARRDQDAKAALSAAQAGLDEYISRLSANSNYWKNGNVDSTNLAFSSGQTIQGTSGAGASYTYKLLSTTTQTASTGQIRIQVTGTSSPGNGRPAVSRTLSATLTPRGYLSFIYLSDVEVVDPTLASDPSACGNYYYNGRSSRGDCSEIQWTGGDTVKGPLHSNDALQINGSVNFTNPQTETSWPATASAGTTTKTWWGTQSYPLSGYKPHYAASVPLPTANDNLQQYVTPGASGTENGPGCYYTGATRIIFQGSQMKVYSPATSSPSTPSRCLDVASRNTEQTKAIPPVIYVDKTTNSCTLGTVGYPASGERYSTGTSTAPSWGNTTNYNCTRGNAYVSGKADSQVTVATADDIVITGDLTLTDNGGGTDVIGLNAGNYVWVYHPLDSRNNNLLSSSNTVNDIQAAVMSIAHSFVVQNWASGSALGNLNVTGAIAQKFRGPVGTGSGSTISTGYYKDYVYDPRLAYLSPPYFLADTSLAWQVAAETDK